ncbi:hypothetical protein WJU23_05190 [Prosthecobacter sp. SYSU 5D2]|uniref:hypothetical protein n=1 Tax=Prosthecobacter sp. SYSU 5D2 TaxID=3134134 RepID=UPI0031FF0683
MTTILDRPTIKISPGGAPVMENARGFRADLGSMMDAQRPVQINSRGFVAEAASIGDIGQGAQHLGGALDAISSKMAEAINTRRIAEAEMAMDAAQSDIAAELAAEPDPAKWGEITAKRTAAMEKIVMTDDLSPDARDAIAIRHLKWSTRTQGEVKISSARQQFQLTAQTLKAAYYRAKDSGNYVAAAEAVNALTQGGYVGADVGANMEIDLKNTQEQRGREEALNLSDAAIDEGKLDEAKVFIEQSQFFKEDEKKVRIGKITHKFEKQQERDNLLSLGIDEPERAMELARAKAEQGKIDGPDMVAIIQFGERRASQLTTEEFTGFKARIDDKDPPSVEELNAARRLSQRHKAALAEYAVKGPSNDPKDYETAFAAVSMYDASKDPNGFQMAQMKTVLGMNFNGAYLEELTKRLDTRTKPGADSELSEGPTMALIEEWVQGGALGSYKKPVTKDGQAVKRDAKKVGFTEDVRPVYGWDRVLLDAVPWGFLMGDQEPTGETVTGTVDVMENDGQPVAMEEIDKVESAKIAAKQEAIRKKLVAEIKAPDSKLKTQEDIAARGIVLFKEAGGTVPPQAQLDDGAPAPQTTGELPPGNGGAMPPSPLLPSIKSIESKIEKYGY